ncbi:hypothetical protein CBL_09971 [Carabus blaptoides fortunei]
MAAVTVLLVLIVSGTSYANITLLDYNTDNISELLEFATGAYHFYCKYCRATLIVHDEDEIISNYFFEMLTHHDFNMSIISLALSGQESTCELNGKFAGTIIELTIVFWTERYYNKPDYFLDSMEKSPYWNRFSKMIIIVTGNIPTDYIGWLEYTFKTFWKRKFLRVFICFWMHGHMQVYMYNPFIEDFAKNISDATTEQYVAYIEYELLELYGYPLKAFIYEIYPYSERVEYGRTDIFDRITYIGLDGHFITEELMAEQVNRLVLQSLLQQLETQMQKLTVQDEKVLDALLDEDAQDDDLYIETEAIQEYINKATLIQLKVNEKMNALLHEGNPTPSMSSFDTSKNTYKLPKIEMKKFYGDPKF